MTMSSAKPRAGATWERGEEGSRAEWMRYPPPEASSQRRRGSTMKRKRMGERGHPWRVPRVIGMGGVVPAGTINDVVAEL